MKVVLPLSLFSFCFANVSCVAKDNSLAEIDNKNNIQVEITKGMEIATFAGGCFWCTEAIFLEIDGVEKVVSGYIGGTTKNTSNKSS